MKLGEIDITLTTKVLYNGLVTAEDYEVSKVFHFLFQTVGLNFSGYLSHGFDLLFETSRHMFVMFLTHDNYGTLQYLGNVMPWVHYRAE